VVTNKKNSFEVPAHGFSHLSEKGAARMVDVSNKSTTHREAEARGLITLGPKVTVAILAQNVKKGDALAVARVAGIMAAKNTSRAIPLCHPIFISGCHLDFEIDEEKGTLTAICRVLTDSQTGVEMEALSGVSGALLTVYDMCKSIDKGMVIGPIWLQEKSGGKSGTYKAPDKG
jgi:cyclic pyranopterin phosphate synthase